MSIFDSLGGLGIGGFILLAIVVVLGWRFLSGS